MKKTVIGTGLFCLLIFLLDQIPVFAQSRTGEGPARAVMPPVASPAGKAPLPAPRLQPLAPAKTDLGIGEFSLSHEKPDLGEMVEVRVVVQNRGDTDAPQVKVQFYAGRRLLGEQIIGLVPARGREQVKFAFKADRPGPQTLRVLVQTGGAAPDTNTANNAQEKILVVSSPPTTQLKGAQPALGKGAVTPSPKTLFDTVQPNLVAKVESATVQGQQASVTLKISNQGTGAAPPFKAGLFTAGPTGAPEGSALAKGLVPAPLGPGAVYALTIPFPPGLIFMANQKFVAVADMDNDIQEGTAGEKDNVTPAFMLTQAGSILVEPLAISDFKVLNPSLLPGEQPNVYGSILGGPVVSWQVSYKYPDGKEFIAHYEKGPFPALKSFGDYVPLPFAVWPKGGPAGPGAKAVIILAVSKGGGQVVKKEAEVTLAGGAEFDGAMNITGVSWKVNGPKLESVTVNVAYTAAGDFVIGNYGNPVYGSVWIALEKFQTFSGSGIGSSKTSLGVCSPKNGNLDYPKTTINKGAGTITLTCLPPSAEIKGLLEYANVWKEKPGIGSQPVEPVCKGCNFYYPGLRVGLNFITPSGVKGVFKDVEVKDAFLDKKTVTYWQQDVGTTGYVCTPCPPGY